VCLDATWNAVLYSQILLLYFIFYTVFLASEMIMYTVNVSILFILYVHIQYFFRFEWAAELMLF